MKGNSSRSGLALAIRSVADLDRRSCQLSVRGGDAPARDDGFPRWRVGLTCCKIAHCDFAILKELTDCRSFELKQFAETRPFTATFCPLVE
jgi:hypothetical protein